MADANSVAVGIPEERWRELTASGVEARGELVGSGGIIPQHFITAGALIYAGMIVKRRDCCFENASVHAGFSFRVKAKIARWCS